MMQLLGNGPEEHSQKVIWIVSIRLPLSLEKWRWKKDYPERYIRVNIPEFTLYFVNGDTVKRKHRVVVGAYATQTPEFHATMRRMITNPFWHVPYSISSTEILYGAKKILIISVKEDTKFFKAETKLILHL